MANVNATRMVRSATSWTRPLQVAVIALAMAQVLYSVSYPYWVASAWNWWDNMVNPGGPQVHWWGWPLPAPGSLHDVLLESLDIYGRTVLTVAIAMAVIVAAIKRWSWAFFAIGVLLALYATARLYNLVQATRRPDPDRRMCGLLGIARIGYRTECTVAAARPPRNGGKGGIRTLEGALHPLPA